jgi:hypothetical protein
MISKSLTTVAFAAGCVLALGAMPSANAQALGQTDVITNGPQATAGDYGEWSPRLNVIESRHYDRLLQTNMAFRAHRERMECGPITLRSLRERCLASFAQYEPAYGATSGYGGGSGEMGMHRGWDAGYNQSYGTSRGDTGYGAGYGSSENPAPSMPGNTPGASADPHTQLYGYR